MMQETANLWSELHKAGERHVNSLSKMMDSAAPEPGHLVFVDTKRLTFRLNEFEPVAFSAIDVSTHLQVARLYLTTTVGSSVDFLDFLSRKFPFPISEIRTSGHSPFSNSTKLQASHPFTSSAAARGILHSVIPDPREDVLLSILSKMTFGGFFEGSIDYSAEQRLMRELINFLFFHNNHRSLPSLGGISPIQKLKQFQGFGHLHVFDPYAVELGLEPGQFHHS
jgi:hypothetical protein